MLNIRNLMLNYEFREPVFETMHTCALLIMAVVIREAPCITAFYQTVVVTRSPFTNIDQLKSRHG